MWPNLRFFFCIHSYHVQPPLLTPHRKAQPLKKKGLKQRPNRLPKITRVLPEGKSHVFIAVPFSPLHLFPAASAAWGVVVLAALIADP